MTKQPDKTHKKSVLFVCMGNICRSPTGEGVMKKLVDDEGLAETIEVDSAGTISYHAGELPDARMREHAASRGYRLDSHARQIRREDLERFDLIVAMDRDNLAGVHDLDPQGHYEDKVRLLSDFLHGKWPKDVPDPYYGGAAGFEKVLDMIEAASTQILVDLRADAF
ncbi:MAG: low molecular weight phosphotyrosine protein phosphatase [Deltaproteobacteria bacterium]|nr:low molecular weight phosphotyrosine protein phosphatase [Deltaproteobacteria bacterium]